MLRTLALTLAFGAIASSALSQVSSDILEAPYSNPNSPHAFGAVIVQSDNLLLVGAPFANVFKGVVHVYERRVDGPWDEVAQLTAPDDLLFFGSAMAIDGNRAAISAPFNESWELDGGRVIIIERQSDGSWTTLAEVGTESDESFFGYPPSSVDFQGDTLVVGAGPVPGRLSGSVYVFTNDGNGNWPLDQQIVSPGPGNEQDSFGESIQLDQGRLVIGARGAGAFGSTSPRVYVYSSASSHEFAWEAILESPMADVDGNFGWRVKSSENLVFASDPFDSRNGDNSGVVFTFAKQLDGTWTEGATLTSSNPTVDDYFGFDMDVCSQSLVVTLSGFDQSTSIGAELFAIANGKVDRVSQIFLSQGHRGLGAASTHGKDVALAQLPFGNFINRSIAMSDISYAGQAFQALPYPVSLEAGTSREFRVDSGIEHAGELYLVLGSMSGTEPGVPLNDPWHLPLNPDPYFNFTLTRPNLWPMANSLGFLDSTGQASIQFAISNGSLPSLSGTELSHAFVVLNLGSGDVTLSSNPVSFDLID